LRRYSLRQKVSETVSQLLTQAWWHAPTQEALGRRIVVQGQPWAKTQDTTKKSKNRLGHMAQMVNCLPSKFRALSSNPSTKKRKKKEKRNYLTLTERGKLSQMYFILA
jgi:hypothetical protein